MIRANRLTPKAGTAAAPAATVPPAVTTAPPVQTAPVQTAPTQAVVATTPVISAEEAAKRVSSLVLDLPEELYSSSIVALPTQDVQSSEPYIGFASKLSPSWTAQQAAGLTDGEMYIHAPSGIQPTPELKFWLLDAFYCFTRVSDNMEILEAKAQLTEAEVKADLFQEHYVCVIFADVEGEMIPAKLELRGARSGAVKQVMNAVKDSAEPGWSEKSDTARIASAFPQPWGRQTAWLRASQRSARTSGRKYVQTSAAIRPTSLSDIEKIVAATKDPAFTATLAEVRTAINERIEEMNNKAVA